MNDDFPIPGRLNLAISALQLVALLGLLAAAGAVTSPWLLAGLAIAYALVMNSAYAMLHEAEHGLLHPNHKLNETTGAVLALFSRAVPPLAAGPHRTPSAQPLGRRGL